MELILASASPRRRELMEKLQMPFAVDVSDCDETLPAGTPVREAAVLLAERKAQAVAVRHPDAVVIGADTVVLLGGEVLGKPKDHADCVRMLGKLSGHSHQVITGVAIVYGGAVRRFSECTSVDFFPLTEQEIADYAATEEPYDKAGAYGIQGYGGLLVSGIRGDYYNVVGLPVARMRRELARFLREQDC